MRTIIVYPLPFDLWEHYDSQVQRFTKTFKTFPPGADCEVYATCHWGEPIDAVRKWFYGIKTRFTPYYANGCDIGATQAVASGVENAFIIGMPTHAYFHREGWLKRFMEAVKAYGPGLYGASGSKETRLHLRTAGYGMFSNQWHDFPLDVVTRQDCTEFETGKKCIAGYAEYKGWPIKVVTWDHVLDLADCRTVPGVFRNGDQNAMLWYDRHCEAYFDADPEEKKRLAGLADGISVASAEGKE